MSNRLPYAVPTSNGLTDRLEDQLSLWEHVVKVAKKRDVDGIFIIGDLLDKALVDPVTLTETVKALMAMPKPTYFIPGNHDAASLSGERYAVEAFGEMGRPDFHVLGLPSQDTRPVIVRPWLNFWPVAFMSADETRGTLEEISKVMNTDITNVLLFHNSINGATHLGWKCNDGMDPEGVLGEFDWALCGHFHDHQEFGDGRGMYLGAPMHHHFGDVGRDACYWVITFDDQGGREDESIDPGLPRFHSHRGLSKAREAKKGDYVRLEIEATHSDWASKLPSVLEVTKSLREQGLRADYKHVPVYHHKTRIMTGDGERKLSWEDFIDQYVDSPDVVLGDLDSEKLKDIGKSILAEVRGKHGLV